jgi:hypothetical protein
MLRPERSREKNTCSPGFMPSSSRSCCVSMLMEPIDASEYALNAGLAGLLALRL